jgi:hypothetical protein
MTTLKTKNGIGLARTFLSTISISEIFSHFFDAVSSLQDTKARHDGDSHSMNIQIPHTKNRNHVGVSFKYNYDISAVVVVEYTTIMVESR